MPNVLTYQFPAVSPNPSGKMQTASSILTPLHPSWTRNDFYPHWLLTSRGFVSIYGGSRHTGSKTYWHTWLPPMWKHRPPKFQSIVFHSSKMYRGISMQKPWRQNHLTLTCLQPSCAMPELSAGARPSSWWSVNTDWARLSDKQQPVLQATWLYSICHFSHSPWPECVCVAWMGKNTIPKASCLTEQSPSMLRITWLIMTGP